MNYWLSYGGGVNSTALAVLLCSGSLPQYSPFRVVFADTGDEKDATYSYLSEVFRPYLLANGRDVEVVRGRETVLQRWQRLKVTGSRVIRSCTEEGKIRPIERHVAASGGSLGQLIGIDAGEAHRAKPRPGRIYPLVELGVDRDACAEIILAAGLPVPVKSGCWHCPFSRVADIVRLVKQEPCKVAIIERLERDATETHGGFRTQWGSHPVSWWRRRAAQGDLFVPDRSDSMPCDCYDG